MLSPIFRRTVPLLLVIGLVPASAGAQRVAEVQISPASVTIAVNQQTGVLATAYDANGNVLPTVEFRWTSANPGVVRVESDPASPGLATLVGMAPGNAQVTAAAGNRTGTVIVQVIAVGGGAAQVGTGTPTVLRIEPRTIQLLRAESRQLAPVFLKDDGSPAGPTTISWRSLAPTVATVSDLGVVTGIADGQGVIELSNPQGLVATAPVVVSGAAIAFAQPVVSLSPGTTVELEVVVPTQGNRRLPNNALTWRSTNPAVVTVSQTGQASALGPGQGRIIVNGFLQEDTVAVTVHRPVAALSVSPRSSELLIVPFGGRRQVEARALAADDTPVPDAPLIWTVRDTTVARFDGATQQISGLKIGATELHLRGPGTGLEATWTVNVVAGGLRIDRQAVGLGIGDTVTLGAAFTDSEGTPLSPASSVTWSSGKPDVAQVTAAGRVTGLGVGRAPILATTPWDAADTMDVLVQGALVFSSNREGSFDLWAMDPAQPGRLHRVTSDAPGNEVNAAYAPDGARVAFVSTRHGTPDLYVAYADGSDWVRLTDTPDVAEDAPAWTSDGRQIVYHAQRRGERAQIWIVNADGSGARQLTRDSATNFQPVVSPDGNTIAFTSTRDGNYEIYLMALDGSQQRNVTQTPAKESSPQWFPSGRLGYIQEQRQGNALSQVVVRKDLPSGEITPLTQAGLPVTDFAIAAAGDLIVVQTSAFAAAGGVENRLYLVPLTGAQPTELTRRPGEQHAAPGFRPARTSPRP